MKSENMLPWTFCENVQIINMTHSNINLKTRLYLLKMNIFYTQQQENIMYSSHLENDSQEILFWSGTLVPLKSIAALSELHHHLSLYDCQLLDHWNKISKKKCYFKASLFTLIYRHVPSKFFTIMTDLTIFFWSYKNILIRQRGKDRKDNDSITMLHRRAKCIPVALGSVLLSALLERTLSLWKPIFNNCGCSFSF